MKRILALILVLMMALSLCACGQQSAASEQKSASSEAAEPAETAEAPVEEAAEAAAEEPAAEEAAEPEEEAEEVNVQAGTQNGNRYENEFIGLGCELDDNWVFAGQEELAQMVGITAEQFDDETFRQQMENADMFYDMMAQNLVDNSTINVLFQNLGRVFGSVISVDQYLKINCEQLEEQLASAGFTDVSYERNTITVGGQECEGLHMNAKIQGMDYYAQQAIIKEGNYIVAITFGTFGEDTSAQLAENFFALG